MLWFYRAFFPVVWIAFLVYWNIKAVDTKTTQRLEPVASRILRVLAFPDRDRFTRDTSHPAALALRPALAVWSLAILARSRHHRLPAFFSPSGRASISAATGAALSP